MTDISFRVENLDDPGGARRDAAQRLDERMQAQHQQYKAALPMLRTIATALRRQVQETCKHHHIEIRDLKKDVKEWGPLRRKIESGGALDWRSASDLIRLRLVVLTPDIARIAVNRLLPLSDRKINDWHWDVTLGRGQGYQGSHMQLTIGTIDGIPQDLGIETAELQVLTVLQDTWDTLTHDKFYKSRVGVTRSDRTRVVRLAALMDFVDQEMVELSWPQVGQRTSDLWASVVDARDNSWLQIPLDEVTLSAAAGSHLKVHFNELCALGRRANFRISAWSEVVRIGLETDTFFLVAHAAKLKTLGDLADACAMAREYERQLTELALAMKLRDAEEMRLFDRPLTVLSAVLMFRYPYLSATAFVDSITVEIRRIGS